MARRTPWGSPPGDEEGVPGSDVGLTVSGFVVGVSAPPKRENREISGCPQAVTTSLTQDLPGLGCIFLLQTSKSRRPNPAGNPGHRTVMPWNDSC